MPTTVFWSWQSDHPGSTGRHFIRETIVSALVSIGTERDVGERPEIDHDVKDTAGIVSIPETILRKIDEAAVFVADITPIAVTASGKYVANPNVLIELGYAKRALGPERIILVWNSSYPGCTPEELPFDLRHRRAPFSYTLIDGASAKDKRQQAELLVRGLKTAIISSLAKVPVVLATQTESITARDGDPSVWFSNGDTLRVNSGTSWGPDAVTFFEGPRSYIRISPAAWVGDSVDGNRNGRIDLLPLGDVGGMSWGRTRGGVICYYVSQRDTTNVSVKTATQWFQKTGEIWGFDGSIVYEIDESRSGLATHYALQCWQRFLRHHAKTFTEYGAIGPFTVEVGITQIKDLFWPKLRFSSNFQPSIEDSLTHKALLANLEEPAIRAYMKSAATELRHAFGFGPFSEVEMTEILDDRFR